MIKNLKLRGNALAFLLTIIISVISNGCSFMYAIKFNNNDGSKMSNSAVNFSAHENIVTLAIVNNANQKVIFDPNTMFIIDKNIKTFYPLTKQKVLNIYSGINYHSSSAEFKEKLKTNYSSSRVSELRDLQNQTLTNYENTSKYYLDVKQVDSNGGLITGFVMFNLTKSATGSASLYITIGADQHKIPFTISR